MKFKGIINFMLIRLLLLILIFLDVAIANELDIYSVFDINNKVASDDQSLWLLSQIFGRVIGENNLLDDTVISTMFKFLNIGIIGFLGGSIGVTIASSTINTAREGVFLGRMLPTAWYPVRVVTGMSFLAPTTYGYSGLQVLILWLAVQGCNLANNVWDSATQFINNNQGAFSPVENLVVAGDSIVDIDYMQYHQITTLGTRVMQAAACNIYNNIIYDKIRSGSDYASGLADTRPGFSWVESDEGNYVYQYAYPENDFDNRYVNCGSFTINVNDKALPEVCTDCDTIKNKYFNDNKIVFEKYYSDLSASVSNIFASCNNSYDCVIDRYNDNSLACNADSCQGLADLEAAAKIYYYSQQNVISSYLTDIGFNQDNDTTIDYDFGSYGWISAGNFYENLATIAKNKQVKQYPLLSVAVVAAATSQLLGVDTTIDDYNTYNYLYSYFGGLFDYSKSLITLAGQNLTSAINALKLANSENISQSDAMTVRQKFYIALAKMMPVYCKAKSGGRDDLQLCSSFTLDNNSAIAKMQDLATFEQGVQDYIAMNDDAVADTSTQITRVSGACAFGTFSLFVSPFFEGELNCPKLPLPSGSFLGIFGYGTVWGDLNPDLTEEILGRNVQVYIYKLGQAWLDAFSSQLATDDSLFLPDFNVIGNISNFGKNLVSSSLDFLISSITDVALLQYNGMVYYTGLSIASQSAAQMVKMTSMIPIDITGAIWRHLQWVPFVNIAAAAGLTASLAIGLPFHTAADIFYTVAASKAQYLQQLFVFKNAFYVPAITAVTVPLIFFGSLLWVFLPVLPFAVYLFTVIGWFMSVIEAVLAGPLIAVGVTAPNGHEFLGRAEQTLILLISVIIRPAVILISFFFAILLTYVATTLAYKIMMGAMAEMMLYITDGSMGDLLGSYFAILLIAYIFVYVLFQVVNLCFSVVYEVPAKVMRWIGAPREDTIGSVIYAIRGEVQQMFGRVAAVGQQTQSSIKSSMYS